MNRVASVLSGILLLFTASAHAAPPVVEQDEQKIAITFDHGVELRFLLHEGMLLGLNTAAVADQTLTSADTVQRPLLAQEYNKPGVWAYLKLEGVRVEGDAVHIDTTVMGGDDRALFEEEFLFRGSKEQALKEGMTPELLALQAEAEAGRAVLHAAIDQDPKVAKRIANVAKAEKRIEELGPEHPETARARRTLAGQQNRLASERRARYKPFAEQSDELGAAYAKIKAFDRALSVRAIDFREIHRDFYAYAHLQLPAESCSVEALRVRVDAAKPNLQPGGTLTWTLRPQTRTIAGWSWVGWSSSYAFKLDAGHEVNNLRQVGTWEIGGDAAGLTVVNMRYRGLGQIEQTLRPDAEGAVAEAWTTTETMPGAAGSAALVSPVVPPSADRVMTDRGYALQHRVGAWISKMARGAGMGFVDFQHRGPVTLISYREKQGNFRALTEVFPGDRAVSQTDEQWFANTAAFETEPKLYLALVQPEQPFGPHEMRTRWQEVDQHVRDVVSKELGFRQFDPLPGVGWLVEMGRAGYMSNLAKSGVKNWHEQGVRMIVTHTPGWWSSQHRNGVDQPQTGGNSNTVYDWTPTADVRESWKQIQRECAARGIPYFVYMTGMSATAGPFVQEEVGEAQEHWGLNVPGADFSHGYPPWHKSHNMLVPKTREAFLARLNAVRTDYGMQGIWADSFQNMYMSQLNWGDGSGAPMQRAWWEIISDWSRKGVNWMGESHAFPGLSCSIEVPGWENHPHYFQYVWKWHRGTAQTGYTPEQHDSMSFRFMANKSWLGPDHKTSVIPSFKRYADEYMAALPSMRRSYVLPDGKGVLWLPFDADDRGVLFVYEAQAMPEGVTAAYILDDAPAAQAEQYHTYAVQGEGLAARFGMRTPPQRDERQDKTYEPAELVYPDWAQGE